MLTPALHMEVGCPGARFPKLLVVIGPVKLFCFAVVHSRWEFQKF